MTVKSKLNENPKPPFDEGADNWIIFGRLARELHNGQVSDPEAAIQALVREPAPLGHAITQLETILKALKTIASNA